MKFYQLLGENLLEVSKNRVTLILVEVISLAAVPARQPAFSVMNVMLMGVCLERMILSVVIHRLRTSR